MQFLFACPGETTAAFSAGRVPGGRTDLLAKIKTFLHIYEFLRR